jgi:hypothetical protein
VRAIDIDEDPDPRMAKRVRESREHPELPKRIAELAEMLRVTRESLDSLQVGWIYKYSSWWWAIPECDDRGRIVGVSYRQIRHGEKIRISEDGGWRGLILPHDLGTNGTLYLCEGMSDTAAMLSAGRFALGRSSAQTSKRAQAWLTRLVAERGGSRRVVVLGDRNQAGIDGARSLAELLTAECGREVRWALPRHGYTDIREQWIATGTVTTVLQGGKK